jgi:hypothetical protein
VYGNKIFGVYKDSVTFSTSNRRLNGLIRVIKHDKQLSIYLIGYKSVQWLGCGLGIRRSVVRILAAARVEVGWHLASSFN